MICKECAQDKEISFFRMSKNRHGNPYQVKKCYACEAIWQSRYNKTIRHTEEYKNKKKKYACSYRSRNSDKIKLSIKIRYWSNREYYLSYSKKLVEDLHECHVLSALCKRNKNLRQVYKQHPELIELKRQQMLLNRTLKNQ